MTSEPLTVLKLNSPEQWLTAIPYMIGFPPRESLVLLCLAGPRKRNQLTIRVDVPAAESGAADLVAALVEPVMRAEPEHLLLVIYRDAGGRPDGLDHALVEEVELAFGAQGVDVLDSLAVRDDRWFLLAPCDDDECCPVDGRPLPEPDERIRAELVLTGHALAESRDELVQRLAQVRGIGLALVGDLCDELADDFITAMTTGERTFNEWCDATLELWRALLREPPRTAELPPRTVARLLVAFMSIHLRDELAQVASEFPQPAIAALTELVRRSPDDYVPGPATILGLVAGFEGNGCLALIAYERALTIDPTYRFAVLLHQALTHGVRVTRDMFDGLEMPRPYRKPVVGRPKRRRRKRR